jgi:hypothetical protein
MSLETRITGRSGMPPLQVNDDRQNLVVDLGGRQSCREVAGDRFGLQEKTAAGQFAGRSVEPDALVDGLVHAGDDLIERARHLARIAGDFRHALLVVVEFFQGHDRQEDIVFLEAVDTGRIVHQDIGVEDEEFGRRGGSVAVGADFGWRAMRASSGMRSVRVADQSWATKSSTSCAWPATLTPRHSRRSTLCHQ